MGSSTNGPATLGTSRGLAKRMARNDALAQPLSKERLPESPPLPDTPGRRRTVEVEFDICDKPGEFGGLLKLMRTKSGMSLPRLASKLEVSYRNLSRFLYTRRSGGSSTIKWFLRFAAATGCKLYLVFPSKHERDRLTDIPLPSTPTLKVLDGERE